MLNYVTRLSYKPQLLSDISKFATFDSQKFKFYYYVIHLISFADSVDCKIAE